MRHSNYKQKLANREIKIRANTPLVAECEEPETREEGYKP